MSSLTTLARPYARAAFDLAREAGDLAGWNAALEAASEVVSQAAAESFLANPAVKPAQAVKLLTDAIGDAAGATFVRFLGVLADNDRLVLLPEVTRLYAALREEAEQRLTVRVVSAIALEDEQSQRMRAALAKRFGREISLENQVDPAVLGGAVIYAGDEVIDGSVRGRLARLQNSLA